MASVAKILASRMSRGVVVALLAIFLALALWLPGLLETIEYRTWDWRARYFAPREEASGSVALVLLDQGSLDWAEENFGLTWPWPREIYGYLASYMARAEVASYAMDVILADPSLYSVADDQALEAALDGLSRDVGAVYIGREEGDQRSWPEELSLPPLEVTGSETLSPTAREALSQERAIFPIPEVARSVSRLGNVQVTADSDGIYRRAPLLYEFDGTWVPGLGLASYLEGAGSGKIVEFVSGALRIGDLRVPIDREGELVLRYKEDAYPAYGAAAVLQSELQLLEGSEPALPPEELAGKHVFFGFSAPGLKDLRPTPLSGSAPGVEIHATLTENLLEMDGFRELPRWAGLLLVVLVALFAGVLGSYAGDAVRSLLLYALLLPLPVAIAAIGYVAGIWIPFSVLFLVVVFALLGANVVNYATEGRQKRFIKGAFSQYLSPIVIEQLLSQPDRLRLGGERRDLSIFFSDIQGFTTISESLSPEELTSLLNEYLSAMTDIIQEEGGTIDKYEGDAIIAFWNAPVPQEDHGSRAVRGALRCQRRLAELRPRFAELCGKEVHMRVGLNSGPAVVGNMGSATRFDYTMLGDAVNLAARLEGVNKQFGTFTMVSKATKEAAGEEFAYRELSRIRVVGKNEPVTVYEPMEREEYRRREGELGTFAEGLAHYYKGNFNEAHRLFEKIGEADAAAGRYVAKCADLQEHPPVDWAGVWLMTEK